MQAAMSGTVLASNLRPPQFGESLTRRPRLERLLDSADSKVILVVSPAGFGKTTLLGNWMKSSTESMAWVSLKSGHDRLPVFLADVARALAPFLSDAVLQGPLATSDNRNGEIQDFADRLLGEIERLNPTWTLILDDYHRITQPDIHQFMLKLIDVMAEESRLVIASRFEPPLRVARLRVHGDLSVITMTDLRASPAETRAALSTLGVELTSLQARAIAERTAGWMTALHMVAKASQSRSVDRVIRSLETFDGDLDLLHEFLVQEVLESRPADVQDFLVKISILDRFNVECCYAVTGNRSAGQFLDRAWRNGLFIEEFGESQGWYRFHPLFREFLRRELKLRYDPASIKLIHHEASRWFGEQNLNDDALIHAVAAGDISSATQMVMATALRLLGTCRVSEVLPWLESFPAEIILADPDLSSMAAFHLVRRGRIAEAKPFLAAAESRWAVEDNRCGLAIIDVIRGTIAECRDEGNKMVEHGVHALSLLSSEPENMTQDWSKLDPLLPSVSSTWMGSMLQIIPYLHIGQGLIKQGRVAEGTRIVENVLHVQTAETDIAGHQRVTAAAGMAWIASGRAPEAEALLDRVMFPDQDDLPVERALALGALAEVMYQWNQIGKSEELLLEGIAAMAQVDAQTQDSRLQFQLARVRLAQGDAQRALTALDAASASAAHLQNRHRMNQIHAMRAGIALQMGEMDYVRNWVLTQRIPDGASDTGKSLQETLTLARLHIADGNVEDAVSLLEECRQTASNAGAKHDLIHVLSLLSIAYLDLFRLDQAVEVLRDALEIGEAGGYIRVFTDEGSSMTRILRIAHRRGLRVHYVNTLLEASGETPEELTKFTHADLVEPITARELDVLRLLALGLTNKEISDELYIAVSTVKRHITNLYGKLGVTSRNEAVQKARKLHLLTATPEGSNSPLLPSLVESTLNCDLLGDMSTAYPY